MWRCQAAAGCVPGCLPRLPLTPTIRPPPPTHPLDSPHPSCRPQLGRGVSEYLWAANDEVTLLVQVETKECFDDLEVRACAMLCCLLPLNAFGWKLVGSSKFVCCSLPA